MQGPQNLSSTKAITALMNDNFTYDESWNMLQTANIRGEYHDEKAKLHITATTGFNGITVYSISYH